MLIDMAAGARLSATALVGGVDLDQPGGSEAPDDCLVKLAGQYAMRLALGGLRRGHPGDSPVSVEALKLQSPRLLRGNNL